MQMKLHILAAASAALIALGAASAAKAQSAMSFFVTSAGPGKGGDLGGLAGADAHCSSLAAAAGATAKNWRAYLSTQGAGAVNARDRIGAGPWTNAKGVVIAKSVDDLHSDANALTKATALTEKGDVVNVLTGSTADGKAIAGEADMTCKNWTSSTAGNAMVGHHDRTGLDESAPMKSWNSSHASRGPGGGCTQDDLKSTGGNGLFYCFAAN
jgi:hypothetical protein